MKYKIITLALALLVGFGFTQKKKKGLKIGDTAPDFSLVGTDDQKHSLADMTDAKGYVVIFTCNHCPYSVAYEDRIIALNNKYKEKGYPVIAINPNNPKSYPSDDFANMKIRAKDKGFTFPYLVDKGQKIYPKYGATRTPHVYLLDKDRKVKYIGAIDNNTKAAEVTEKYLENAIEALLKGEDPKPNFTKAIGCSIKK
jgi:peroxiredoxin